MNIVNKVKFNILYNNGKTDEIIREVTDEKLEQIAEVINKSFKNGLNAVIRLNTDNKAILINVQQVSRVKIEYL